MDCPRYQEKVRYLKDKRKATTDANAQTNTKKYIDAPIPVNTWQKNNDRNTSSTDQTKTKPPAEVTPPVEQRERITTEDKKAIKEFNEFLHELKRFTQLVNVKKITPLLREANRELEQCQSEAEKLIPLQKLIINLANPNGH